MIEILSFANLPTTIVHTPDSEPEAPPPGVTVTREFGCMDKCAFVNGEVVVSDNGIHVAWRDIQTTDPP